MSLRASASSITWMNLKTITIVIFSIIIIMAMATTSKVIPETHKRRTREL